MTSPLINYTYLLALLAFYSPILKASQTKLNNITMHKLDNGIKVWLAPNQDPDIFQLKIIINVGFENENESNAGLSHLLEHAVFYSEHLPDDSTFQDVVRDMGGMANAYTSRLYTTYHGSVHPEQSTTLVNIFSKMLANRLFSDTQVKKASAVVMHEIGPSFPLWFRWFFSDIDFGINVNFKNEEIVIPKLDFIEYLEELNTPKYSSKDVQRHFENFYTPVNTSILASGKFDSSLLIERLNKGFGQIPNLKQKKNRKLVRNFDDTPYHDVSFSTLSPNLKIGIKFGKLTLEDYLILSSYFENFRNRLNKLIRNKEGDSYYIDSGLSYRPNAGLAFIQASFTPSKHAFYRKKINQMLMEELGNKKLSNEVISTSVKNIFLSILEEGPSEDFSMSLATKLKHVDDNFNDSRNPLLVLRSINPDSYRERLRVIYHRSQPYIIEKRPQLFFMGEVFVLNIILLVATLFLSGIGAWFGSFNSSKSSNIIISVILLFICFALFRVSHEVSGLAVYLIDGLNLSRYLIINEFAPLIAKYFLFYLALKAFVFILGRVQKYFNLASKKSN